MTAARMSELTKKVRCRYLVSARPAWSWGNALVVMKCTSSTSGGGLGTFSRAATKVLGVAQAVPTKTRWPGSMVRTACWAVLTLSRYCASQISTVELLIETPIDPIYLRSALLLKGSDTPCASEACARGQPFGGTDFTIVRTTSSRPKPKCKSRQAFLQSRPWRRAARDRDLGRFG